MRAMWRGAISFGLVTIAVRLYSATEEHDFRFHQVHKTDNGRIRYKRVCSVCGEEVEFADIAKGYEMDDGRMVVLDTPDFEHLPIKTDRAIEVLEFVPVDDVDPLYFQKSYYLEPDKAAVRPYLLLRDALTETNQLAVVKITIRQRETLAMVRAGSEVLQLHTMLWPDEIRQADFGFLNDDVEVRPQELTMAKSLVESMAGEFKPEEFTDDYRAALRELIEAKAEGTPIPEEAEEEASSGEVIDLMSALEQSVERARSSRSQGSRASSGSAKSTTADAEKPAAKSDKSTASGRGGPRKAPRKKRSA